MTDTLFVDNPVTVDQLLVFSTIVETGSFSAAARRLKRTQGAISYNISTLEGLIDVVLFDRSGRRPVLTDEGRTLLASAGAVLDKMAQLNTVASGIRSGLEASLSVAVDTLYSPSLLAEVIREFQGEFPTVSLDIRTGILSSITDQLENDNCQIGITGVTDLPAKLVPEPCGTVELIAVAAPNHPLHLIKRAIADAPLREHTNIVLSTHGTDTSKETAPLSGNVWRINDSEVRRELVRAGLGWARMPLHQVEDDLKQGLLRKLSTKRWKLKNTIVQLSAVFPRNSPPGPAGRWFLDRVASA
jgi:DNA-binding transcriptional LysR family regulator